MEKTITIERLDRVILAVLLSPNKSGQRAGLWSRLHSLRRELKLV